MISVLDAINVAGKAQARKKGKSRKASKKNKKWKKSQGGRTDKPRGEKQDIQNGRIQVSISELKKQISYTIN